MKSKEALRIEVLEEVVKELLYILSNQLGTTNVEELWRKIVDARINARRMK